MCVIGDSHTGALRKAANALSPDLLDEASLTFFSAPAALLRELRGSGRALAPATEELRQYLLKTTGGKERIEIASYDAFVLVGMKFGLDIPRLFGQVATAAHLKWGKAENLVSGACLNAILRARLKHSEAVRMAIRLRRKFAGPLILCAVPFRPEKILDEPKVRDDGRFRDVEILRSVVDRAKAISAEIGADLNIDVIWQDESTSVVPGFTKRCFERPTTKKMREEGREDRFHANEEYGKLLHAQILRRLERLDGTASDNADRGRVIPLPSAKERSSSRRSARSGI